MKAKRSINPSHLPPSPFTHWGDDTLERKFAGLWVEVNDLEKGGYRRQITLLAMHDELTERGIDPAKPLRQRGFDVESIEVPA